MAGNAAVVLAYLYPVALCVVLMGYRLATYRADAPEHTPKRVYNRVLFVLQCVVLCSVLASLSIKLYEAIGAPHTHHYRQDVSQAEILSDIAVFLYFAAILLPTPDRAFAPDAATSYSWLVAAIFEAAKLGLGAALSPPLRAAYHAADFALGLFRALVLGAMFLIHMITSGQSRKGSADEHDETSPLLSEVSAKKGQVRPKDAQSLGWLDYFLGFYVLFPYIWPSDSRRHQIVALFCFGLLILQRIVNILVPYQLEIITLALSERYFDLPQLVWYIIFRGIQGQQGIIGSFRAILWIPISQRLFQRLSCDAFEHVLSLSLDFHLNSKVGEVIAALSKGGALNTFFDGFVFQLFPMVFDLVIAATYVFVRFDAIYSLVIIGVLWGYIFVTINMAIYRGRARRQMADADRGMNATKVDAIMAYETVHYNRAQEIEGEKFHAAVELFQKSEFSVLLSLNGLNVIQNTIFTIGIALVTIISAYQISEGSRNVASFVSLLAYFSQLHAPLAFFGSFFNQVQNNLVDAERMLELFTTRPSIVDEPDAVSLTTAHGRIVFKNVNFTYDGKVTVLNDISFVVEPGTVTAIVGESGSGKSTCLKLLFRFYDITSGRIVLDDLDIKHVKLNDLRRQMAVVPQQQDLFHTSIENNVLYSNPNASFADVQEVCRIANIHDRIMSFPDRYETIVGERGLRLSGGEKQRIVLARALLKRSPVLLLDEATASLDSRTEGLIQEALEKAMTGRTSVVVAHRLSTIMKADQILVMDRGQIVERGTHGELLRLNGLFKKMWDKQIQAEQGSLET